MTAEQDFAREAYQRRQQEFASLTATLPAPLAALRALTPGLFREAVSAMFTRLDYVDMTDDTVQDLVLRKAGRTYLVACAPPTQIDPIRVPALACLHTAITTASAQAGYSITPHAFTPEAHAYAATAPLHLVDGVRLATLMQESMAGVGLPETYQSMCCHCGGLVQHRLDGVDAVPCPQGHLVAPTIARAALVGPGVAKVKIVAK